MANERLDGLKECMVKNIKDAHQNIMDVLNPKERAEIHYTESHIEKLRTIEKML